MILYCTRNYLSVLISLLFVERISIQSPRPSALSQFTLPRMDARHVHQVLHGHDGCIFSSRVGGRIFQAPTPRGAGGTPSCLAGSRFQGLVAAFLGDGLARNTSVAGIYTDVGDHDLFVRATTVCCCRPRGRLCDFFSTYGLGYIFR